MKVEFIELPAFSRARDDQGLTDEWLATLQLDLMLGRGHVYRPRQLGGFCKVRAPNPTRGKGKSGGYRVYFVPFPDLAVIVLALLSDKDVETNISPSEQAHLKGLAGALRQEVERYVGSKK